ncbi:hypothetical protein AOQ84DRAFT_377896, partial [Glonium stellatum]
RVHEVLWEEEEDGEEDEEADVWDLKYGSAGRMGAGMESAEEDIRPKLPDYEMVQGKDGCPIPPCFVVQVEELPRGADIEWTSLGLAKARIEMGATATEPKLHVTRILGTDSRIISGGVEKEHVGLIKKLIRQSQESKELDRDQYTIYTSQAIQSDLFEGLEVKQQIIPCQRIWGEDGKELAVAVVVRSTQDTWK